MPTISTQTILLVEDEENDVTFMTMAMERAGYAAGPHVVEDGAEAIAYLSGTGRYADRTRHPLPALVMLDLKLPKVMGMDVLKWIRDQPTLDMMVVIMMTSSQQRADIRMACSLGANSYLVKPSNPLHLVETMELIKRYWLGLNQPTATFPAPAAHL